ncbi:hypothetical protein [Cyclobacterium sp.]|nr:hypothetical protein [Cyclobacterium sp.]
MITDKVGKTHYPNGQWRVLFQQTELNYTYEYGFFFSYGITY